VPRRRVSRSRGQARRSVARSRPPKRLPGSQSRRCRRRLLTPRNTNWGANFAGINSVQKNRSK
jgi:hypothetical protein